MTEIDLTRKSLIEEIKSAKKAKVIQPVEVGQTSKRNELVFFIKPELLDVDDNEKIFNSMALIEGKFRDFQVEVSGTAVVPGTFLEDHEIMNRHYGFINQLSRKASEMVDQETRSKMFEHLDIDDLAIHKVMGGHEFLEAFKADIETLNEIWFAQEANKLRSGFYFIADTYQARPILLVNGFHPSQLRHFTSKDHCILLLLLHTDTDWEDLKFKMVGDTFPERADQDSIRGMLYKDPGKYGQADVGINTNGVHLSAGPFEAAFETVNFFGALIDLDPEETPPLAIKKAVELGLDKAQALTLMDNPTLNESDIFTETENLNTGEAVQLAIEKLFD